ncbi:hypothetical protein [Massilia sp. erpn]|uniref:hypothetical protein n=1 Tax=Massilia sp. erpn TaxID=2738142 RepID=UPI0021045C62|nr:hypothetical protein [Massilia sp. erpn]UTY59410.1 hypothetical protein HPQ68_20880 [Massilia sp. erpn]
MNSSDMKVDVAIYLRGEQLDPGYISSVLKLTPSKSKMRGEKSFTSSGKEIIAQMGIWAVYAQKNTGLLSDMIEELTEKITVFRGKLNSLQGVENAYVDIFMATDSNENGEGNFSFELASKNIIELASLGLVLKFTGVVINP